MQALRKSQLGVTLMELMAVVAIIGILSAISIPNFVSLIRNHRLRQSSIVLLSALRRERSRALSLSREIKVDLTAEERTFEVKKLEFTFYDPMQLSMGLVINSDDAVFTEPEETLGSGTFRSAGLEEVVFGSGGNTLGLTFSPSGTIDKTVMITLRNRHLSYQIQVYRGGQIQFFRN